MNKRGSWFRNLVLWAFDNWIEGASLLLFIMIVYISYQLMQDDFTRNFGVGLLCIGTLVVFLVSWLFFCAIETRDLLKSIEENTRGVSLIESPTLPDVDYKPSTPAISKKEPAKPKLADDEQLCPSCSKRIKKSAKKCRFCGEWLEDTNRGQ